MDVTEDHLPFPGFTAPTGRTCRLSGIRWHPLHSLSPATSPLMYRWCGLAGTACRARCPNGRITCPGSAPRPLIALWPRAWTAQAFCRSRAVRQVDCRTQQISSPNNRNFTHQPARCLSPRL